ncbi:MAG: hypothetical protein ABEJ73_06885 [Haloplanus sp.]
MTVLLAALLLTLVHPVAPVAALAVLAGRRLRRLIADCRRRTLDRHRDPAAVVANRR